MCQIVNHFGMFSHSKSFKFFQKHQTLIPVEKIAIELRFIIE